MPRVRIVVLNYNTAILTIDLVNNLVKQNYDEYEIVVVDNNSLYSDQQLLSTTLPNSITLIQSKVNLGYSAGNNLGMKYNSGFSIDYFLIMNSDLQLDDIFFIKKLILGFEMNISMPILAQSPLVDTQSCAKPIGIQIQARKLLSPVMLYFLSFSLFKIIFPRIFNTYIYADKMPFENKYLVTDSINGAAFMIKAEFIKSINYLDENVFLYHEEMILAKQIHDCGGKCLLNGFLQIKHIQGAATKSNLKQFNGKMERLKYQSEAYFFLSYLKIHWTLIVFFKFLKKVELSLKRIIKIF